MMAWIDRVWRQSRNFATHLFNIASQVDDRHGGGVIMKTWLLLIGSLVVCLLTVSVPAFAHHAWHGYDMANVTTVKGTVTQFDWGNPHVWISLEVQGDK